MIFLYVVVFLVKFKGVIIEFYLLVIWGLFCCFFFDIIVVDGVGWDGLKIVIFVDEIFGLFL